MDATGLIKIVVGAIVPVGTVLFAIRDVRRRNLRRSRDGVPGPPAVWPSAKARDLLGILIAQRRPVPRKQLIAQLWPREHPVVASNRLSALLSKSHDAPRTRDHAEAGPLASDGTVVWLRDPGRFRGGNV